MWGKICLWIIFFPNRMPLNFSFFCIFLALESAKSHLGDLLITGYQLFLPTVQVNFTGYFTETWDWNIFIIQQFFSIFWKNISCLLPTNVLKISITCCWPSKFITRSHLAKWPLPCFLSILLVAKWKGLPTWHPQVALPLDPSGGPCGPHCPSMG